MHDEQFFSWPPSPQLALAVFPYIRSIYYNMYKELVLPYETKLNRQLLGLPATEPRPEPANQNQNNGGQRQDNNQNAARAARAQGGILGLLQTLIDALEQDEEADGEPRGVQRIDDFQIDIRAEQNGEEEGGDGEEDAGLMLEVVVEEVDMDEAGQADQAGDVGLEEPVEEEEEQNVVVEPAEPVPAPIGGNEAPAAAAPEEAAPNPAVNGPVPAAGPPAQNHEAPQAPARRMGLGAILSSVSNAIVSALILPGVSFAAGEALRLVLPKDWTAAPLRNPWMRSASIGGRPGLFQQQWGRSLVGGCLFIVLRDILRVYTKTRKVTAMSNRRVKNVDRPRRKR